MTRVVGASSVPRAVATRVVRGASFSTASGSDRVIERNKTYA
jgi:hypothetical protein